MLEPNDYELPEPIPIRECAECDEDIMCWEDYYKIGDDLIHDDCIIKYIRRFKVMAD